MGTAAASAGAAGPSRDYGLDGAADGLSRSTPRHADDTTKRPSGSGPTRESDARDSEPDYLLRPTRQGPGCSRNLFYGQRTNHVQSGAYSKGEADTFLPNDIFDRFGVFACRAPARALTTHTAQPVRACRAARRHCHSRARHTGAVASRRGG
jgi:hypothetical protein